MLKKKIIKSPRKRTLHIQSKKVPEQAYLYKFPDILGFEEISSTLNSIPAENIFNALLHGFALKPILDEKCSSEAERMLEYLDRAFETEKHPQIEYYSHILILLLEEYDHKHHIKASSEIPPHEFLKALLQEDKISQKSLVPECFRTESQLSEFLHQKKGRSSLSYNQATLLGAKFKVNPLNFLQT